MSTEAKLVYIYNYCFDLIVDYLIFCYVINAGQNKMVINHLEKLFVTNDAATILRELEVCTWELTHLCVKEYVKIYIF